MRPETIKLADLEGRYADFCLTMKSLKQAVGWRNEALTVDSTYEG